MVLGAVDSYLPLVDDSILFYQLLPLKHAWKWCHPKETEDWSPRTSTKRYMYLHTHPTILSSKDDGTLVGFAAVPGGPIAIFNLKGSCRGKHYSLAKSVGMRHMAEMEEVIIRPSKG